MEVLRTPLGHVTMVPKGTYDSTTTYNRLDLVTYTDNDRLALYIAKEDNLNNIPPSTTTSWMKVIDSSDLDGPTGPQGATGPTGPTGEAAGFALGQTGSVTILDPNSSPSITITPTGPNTAKVFDFAFGIPQGPKGETGNTGPQGETGEAAGFALEQTGSVTMLDPGSTPSVTITPTGPNTAKVFDFNFNIPKGDTGPQGETGLSIVTNPIHLELTNDQLDFGLFESSIGSGDSNVEFRITPSNQQAGVFITRYALPNSGESLKRLTLLDTSGNSSFPGNLQVVGDLNLPYHPLTIQNGGTGANTTTEARQNLEITPANIGALSVTGGTVNGQITFPYKATSWYTPRDTAALKISSTTGGLTPIIDVISKDGDWSMSIRHNSGNTGIYFNYVQNNDYDNKNSKSYRVILPSVSTDSNMYKYLYAGRSDTSYTIDDNTILPENTIMLVYE